MAEKWVWMSHPDIPKTDDEPARVTVRAFKLAHESKGWVVSEDPRDASGNRIDAGTTPAEAMPAEAEVLDSDSPTADAEPTNSRRRSTSKEGS